MIRFITGNDSIHRRQGCLNIRREEVIYHECLPLYQCREGKTIKFARTHTLQMQARIYAGC